MKIITKKKFKEETWNIDWELIKWINEHFKGYLEYASKKVDLEYHKFTYRGKEYTQKELINKVIELTDYLLDDYFEKTWTDDTLESVKNEMYSILSLIHWSMWW